MGLATWSPELRRWLEETAREAGFDSAGVAEVRDADDPYAAEEAARFAAWVEAGRAGEMEYLKRRDDAGTLVRSGLRVVAVRTTKALPFLRITMINCSDDCGGSKQNYLSGPGATLGAMLIPGHWWSGLRPCRLELDGLARIPAC
jgi:hypothetical protein